MTTNTAVIDSSLAGGTDDNAPTVGEIALGYDKFEDAETVDVKEHSNLVKKYIHPKILAESNYYKNLILKIQNIKEII